MAKKKSKMSTRVMQVPDAFWTMKPEEKWMFVRDMLATFSPNESVRAQKADKQAPKQQ